MLVMAYIRYFVAGIIILFLHMIIVPLIAIEKIPPDLMLILIVYIALKNGQIAGSIAGFVSGLLIDFFVDFAPGISALAKTISGFVAGYFYNETKIEINTETIRFPGIVLLCSLINNLIYFSPEILAQEFGEFEILKTILARALYTTILSLIPLFTISKRMRMV